MIVSTVLYRTLKYSLKIVSCFYKYIPNIENMPFLYVQIGRILLPLTMKVMYETVDNKFSYVQKCRE